MNRVDIVYEIHKVLSHLTVRVVDEATRCLIDTMIRTICSGERIEIRDFGIFKIRTLQARQARDPRNGKIFKAGKKAKVFFRPGKRLLKRLNSEK